jgi:hypothetical protein
MYGFHSLMVPNEVMQKKWKYGQYCNHDRVVATSSEKVYDMNYYLKSALAGAICCAITHGALTYVTFMGLF